MNIKHRLTKLEQVANVAEKVDVATILNRGRDAVAKGERLPRTPCPPEYEHSRSPLARALFAAQRRVGI